MVDLFESTAVTGEQRYFRLQGIGGARNVYTDAEFEQLAEMLPEAPRMAPYVLFNNLPRVEDPRRYRAILAKRRAG